MVKRAKSLKYFGPRALKAKIHEIIMKPVDAFKSLCFMIGFSFLSFCLLISLVIGAFFYSLPDIEKMSFTDVKKMAIKRVGKRFEVKSKGVSYRWIRGPDISRYLIYSVVMSEDGKFFEHGGVDYNAIMASMIKNLRKKEYAAGASTITQQVVKNIFLTNEKSLMRKLKEYFISRRLEDKFSKNQILELYFNIAEFGPDIYGVHQACAHYFSTSPKKVNAAQGAFLALMLPSPRRYYLSIYKNKYLSKKHKSKLRRILRDMLAMEYISPKQYSKLVKYRYF